jgi:hypothetical protein
MGKIFTELVKKHEFGMVMSAIAIVGYRRTVRNYSLSKEREQIRAEAPAAKEAAQQADKEEYLKFIEE